MMTEYGAEIAVDGKRPEWLKDDEQVLRISSKGHDDWTGRTKSVAWELTRAIRLPADHPYYRATEAGYKYWPGGSMPPQDWDNGTVLFRDNERRGVDTINRWKDHGGGADVIGYKPRPMPAAAPPAPPPMYPVAPRWAFELVEKAYAEYRNCVPGVRNVDIVMNDQYAWTHLHAWADYVARTATAAPQPTPQRDGAPRPNTINVDKLIALVQAGDLAAAQALIAPPVDPVVLRARGICRKHAPLGFDDGSAIMHVAIAALKEPLTDDQLVRIVRAVVYQARNEGGHFPAWNHSDILHGRYDKFGLFVNMLAAARDAI